jgi:hypothetical protein
LAGPVGRYGRKAYRQDHLPSLNATDPLGVTATVFQAHQWALYAAASVLIALTYGLLGVLIGPIFGRVSGVFIAFLVPFLDLGIAQSPMLRLKPAEWAHPLPGYGGVNVNLRRDHAVASFLRRDHAIRDT